MASVSKLSIRGVRAFSPHDEEQVVEFFFPCTIIVGANGCGKTTITEALKFAVCGAMPPGNKNGHAFVHDPKSLGESVVKANVKLRFTNQAGNSMVVVRSMEVQQKKKNMTFKQLDGVLRTTDTKTGNRVSLSHKCSELDRQIPILMGVSRAILDNVVFCHQEEASWPLQDASVLKKKFDEIFDSSRYSKALKVLQENKKNFNSQAKDLKADVAGLTSHRHAANEFRKEINKHNIQMDEVDEEVSNITKQINTYESEKERLEGIMLQISEIENVAESKRNEKTQELAVVKKQRQLLTTDYTNHKSIIQLNEMLRSFDEEIDKRLESQHELQKEVSKLQSNIKELNLQEKDINSNKGRLEALHEEHEKNLKIRYDKMVSIGTTYGLESCLSQVTQQQNQNSSSSLSQTTLSQNTSSLSFRDDADATMIGTDITSDDMKEFFRHLARKDEELNDMLVTCRNRNQKQEDEIQSLLSDLIGKQKSIDNDREKLNKEQKEAQDEIRTIISSQSAGGGGIGGRGGIGPRVKKMDIDDLKKRAEKIAKERDIANNDPRRQEIPIEVRGLETKIDKLARLIEDEKTLIDLLRTSSDMEREVTLLKEQCARDLEELAETINEHSYTLQKHNLEHPGELPGAQGGDEDGVELNLALEGLRDKIQEKYDDSRSKHSNASDEVARLERKISEWTALLEHDRKSFTTLFNRKNELENTSLKDAKDVVAKVKQYEHRIGINELTIDESAPKELLSYLKKRLAEEEADASDLPMANLRKLKKRFKKLSRDTKGPKGNPTCPCCTREFTSEAQIKEFTSLLEDFLDSPDSPILKRDADSEEVISKYRKWVQTVSENVDLLLEYSRLANDNSDLEHRIAELERNIEKASNDLSSAQEEEKDFEALTDEHRELLDNAKRWADSASRIAQKRRQTIHKKDDLSLSMTTGNDPRDLKTVESDYEKKVEEKESYLARINRLNKEMSTLNEKTNRVTTQAANIEQQVRIKEQQYAKQQQMAERKTALNDKITQCAEEDRKLHEQLAPLQEKIRKKENEKSRMRTLGGEEEAQHRTACNSFATDVSSLKEISEKIDDYIESNKDSELEELLKESEVVQTKIRKKQAEIDTVQPELEALTRAIGDQENHKKNLQENIAIIKSENNIDKLDKEIEKLEESIASVEGQATCDTDLEHVMRQLKEYHSTRARLDGRRSEIVESIRGLKRKLSTPEYKNVEDQYNVANIKYETTQMLVKDIEKYHTALDKALLEFHSRKIAEINKIIRDLWSLTYKGEDITSIQLVSGQEAGSKAAKSYNYRVVMAKGSTQMDMRGRCSAGQRVLASIVIRLALAETFCVNCGCIALDEPTVNLDYNNKRGLAIAIAQIVAQRSQQRNFQLIMITHDEEFVSMMKTELSAQTGFTMPEKYFQVRREEGTDGKFYSKIDAVDWDDI